MNGSRAARAGRLVVAAAAAGLVFFLASGPAWADTKVVTDGNDVSGPLDIKSASHGHSGRFVVHTVSMFEPFSSSLLQGGYSVTFQFSTDGNSSTFERYVFVLWGNGRLRALVANKTRVIGTASVSRPNGRTLRVKIPKKLINPKGYSWLVASFRPSGFDVCQLNGRLIYHDLSPPAVRLVALPDVSTAQSASLTFPVTIHVSDRSPIRLWQLQSRLAGSSGWTTAASGAGHKGHWFKTKHFTGQAGKTYEFRVRATDRAGNTGVSATGRISVPRDDADPAFASAYGGTFDVHTDQFLEFLTTRHSLGVDGTFTYSFTGTEVMVIGTKSGVFGPATVAIDGGAPTTIAQAINFRTKLFRRAGLGPGPHTIVVSGAVDLDGFVFR